MLCPHYVHWPTRHPDDGAHLVACRLCDLAEREAASDALPSLFACAPTSSRAPALRPLPRTPDGLHVLPLCAARRSCVSTPSVPGGKGTDTSPVPPVEHDCIDASSSTVVGCAVGDAHAYQHCDACGMCVPKNHRPDWDTASGHPLCRTGAWAESGRQSVPSLLQE